jgi:hypothetical protein
MIEVMDDPPKNKRKHRPEEPKFQPPQRRRRQNPNSLQTELDYVGVRYSRTRGEVILDGMSHRVVEKFRLRLNEAFPFVERLELISSSNQIKGPGVSFSCAKVWRWNLR